eukprot:CAMPEP_0172932308 /NCGR_PEP_ID=MMETSP1075-20121228/219935_1 /TAXON_ID=2916 /ORGANISM="Ceratium fusus, Strain PA161109" /LENGTH=365 /DNA_ID=CAMNT_0013793635 /DNA_START=110 /DNA_END=1207 /DNA_ORIENTATION=-
MTGDMTNSDFSGTERPCGLTQLEDDSSSSRGAVVAASASAGDQQAAETHPVPDIANMPQAVEWLRKAGMWSVGSAKHGSGLCRPCHYCHTKDGCRAGEDCQFCHLPHTSVDQKRPCRARRRQCRIIADIVKDSGEDLDHGGMCVPDIANMPQAVEWLRKAGMWSVGSAKHGSGLCRPCHYCHTEEGCKNKEACQFCHLPHTSINEKRPGKARRHRCRLLADTVKDSAEVLDHGEYLNVLESVGSNSAYMQRVLKHKQNPDDTDGRNIVALERRLLASNGCYIDSKLKPLRPVVVFAARTASSGLGEGMSNNMMAPNVPFMMRLSGHNNFANQHLTLALLPSAAKLVLCILLLCTFTAAAAAAAAA